MLYGRDVGLLTGEIINATVSHKVMKLDDCATKMSEHGYSFLYAFYSMGLCQRTHKESSIEAEEATRDTPILILVSVSVSVVMVLILVYQKLAKSIMPTNIISVLISRKTVLE